MEIKIGFTDNTREVAIQVDREQHDVLTEITDAIDNGKKFISLTDDKGQVLLADVSRIAWVHVGTPKATRVGFNLG